MKTLSVVGRIRLTPEEKTHDRRIISRFPPIRKLRARKRLAKQFIENAFGTRLTRGDRKRINADLEEAFSSARKLVLDYVFTQNPRPEPVAINDIAECYRRLYGFLREKYPDAVVPPTV